MLEVFDIMPGGFIGMQLVSTAATLFWRA